MHGGSSDIRPVRPARFILEGVPRVHFYEGGPRCPEDIIFPSCLRAVMDYLGDTLGCEHLEAHGREWCLDCTYSYLIATSGAAFRLSWKAGWHPDNVDLMYTTSDPEEPFRRAFASVGYGYEAVNRAGPDSERVMRERIAESIDNRKAPVFAFGVVGPPECCLVTGYDECGDVLIGWNFFQGMPEFTSGLEGLEFEPTGEFRRRRWIEDTEAIMLLGERHERPPLEQVTRDTLRYGLRIMHTPSLSDARHGNLDAWKDRSSGLAAYDAWAAAITDEADLPRDDFAALRARFEVHDDAVGTVAECRWYGARFLRSAAKHLPAMAERLLSAASCFEAEHDIMWKVWGLAGGNGRTDEHARRFADPAARREMAALIRASRDRCAEAAAHLQAALETEPTEGVQ